MFNLFIVIGTLKKADFPL